MIIFFFLVVEFEGTWSALHNVHWLLALHDAHVMFPHAANMCKSQSSSGSAPPVLRRGKYGSAVSDGAEGWQGQLLSSKIKVAWKNEKCAARYLVQSNMNVK